MKFTFKSEDNGNTSIDEVVEISTNAECISDVVDAFDRFLKASGFSFHKLEVLVTDSEIIIDERELEHQLKKASPGESI